MAHQCHHTQLNLLLFSRPDTFPSSMCLSLLSVSPSIFYLSIYPSNLLSLYLSQLSYLSSAMSAAAAAAAAAAVSLQSCPTLCDPIDGSPRGSPVPGILQARALEWAAISFYVSISLSLLLSPLSICLSAHPLFYLSLLPSFLLSFSHLLCPFIHPQTRRLFPHLGHLNETTMNIALRLPFEAVISSLTAS